MANKKISQLPAAAALTGEEILPVVQAGGTVSAALADLPVSDAAALALAAKADLVAGKIPAAQLPTTVMEFQGVWNASSNSPTLADGTGSPGDYWRVGTAGTRNLGSGSIKFAAGDAVILSAALVWQKAAGSGAASGIDVTPLSSLAGTDVQAVLADIDTRLPEVESSRVDPTAAIYGGADPITGDWTPAFQAAINAIQAGATTSRCFSPPDGTYKLLSALLVTGSDIEFDLGPGVRIDLRTSSSSAGAFLIQGAAAANGDAGFAFLAEGVPVGASSVRVSPGDELGFKRDDFVQICSDDFYEVRTAVYGANTGQKLGEFAQVLATAPDSGDGMATITFRSPLAGGFVDDWGVPRLTYTIAPFTGASRVRKIIPVENVRGRFGTILGKFGRALNGKTIAGSDVLTAITPTTDGVTVGMPITGTGVPGGATVLAILTTTSVQMSAPATVTSVAAAGIPLMFNSSAQTGVTFILARNCQATVNTRDVATLGLQFTQCDGCQGSGHFEGAWSTLGYGCAASGGSRNIRLIFTARNCRHAFTTGGGSNTYGPVRDIWVSGHGVNTHPTTGDMFDTHACTESIHFADCVSIGSGGAACNIEGAGATITNFRSQGSRLLAIGLTNHTFAPSNYTVDGARIIGCGGAGVAVACGVVNKVGVTTAASAIVTGIASTFGLVAGMGFTAPGFPAESTVLSVDSISQVTMSTNATTTGLQVAVGTVTGTDRLSGTGFLAGVDALVGKAITGTGIPGSTTLLAVVSDTELQISNPATATGSITATINAATISFRYANSWRAVNLTNIYTLLTVNSPGVSVLGFAGAEIRNVDLSHFTIDKPGAPVGGLWLKHVPGAIVRSGRLVNVPATQHGVRLEFSARMDVEGVHVAHASVSSGRGYHLLACTAGRVAGGSVPFAGVGLYLDDACADMRISGVDVTGCTTSITRGAGVRNTVRDCPGITASRVAVNYQVLSSDAHVAITATGKTTTLPNIADFAVGNLLLVKYEAASGSHTLAAKAGETIEGGASITLAPFGYLRLYRPPTGTDWMVS